MSHRCKQSAWSCGYNVDMNNKDMAHFQDILSGLQHFVLDNDADLDLAFDWVQDQSGINPADSPAHWDAFIKAFEAAQ